MIGPEPDHVGRVLDGSGVDGVQLRAFRSEDAPDLARFFWEREFDSPGGLFHGLDRVESLDVQEIFARERTTLALLAIRDAEIVGSIEFRQIAPDVQWICSLYVAAGLRGRGLGVRLGFAVIQLLARQDPATGGRVQASYNPANRTAIHIYSTLGVVETACGALEVLTHALMRVPAFRRFAARHSLFANCDVYRRAFTFDATDVRRILPGIGDFGRVERFEWRGQRVYPQRFAVGDDWVEVLVDAATLTPCRVAVPEWSAEVVPRRSAATPSLGCAALRVTNSGSASLPVTLPGDSTPTTLLRGEELEAEGVPADDSADSNARQPLILSLGIDGEAMKLGCVLPANPSPALADRPPASRELPRALIQAGKTVVQMDPALGGSLSSLTVHGRETLRTSRAGTEGSLGWIYPWKGGLFTLVSHEDVPGSSPFRLPPWGPFPGWVGFNTEPAHGEPGQGWYRREATRGPLVEQTRFVLVAGGLEVQARVENRGAADVRATFALFAFLAETSIDDGPGLRVSADGQERAVSRRSFELTSRRLITIHRGSGGVRLAVVDGDASACAFNLGDDGVHFLLQAGAQLGPSEAFAVCGRLELDS